jgi:hypothetical protein
MRMPSGSVMARLREEWRGSWSLQHDLGESWDAGWFTGSFLRRRQFSALLQPGGEGGILKAMLLAEGNDGLAAALEGVEQGLTLFQRDEHPAFGVGTDQAPVLCGM